MCVEASDPSAFTIDLDDLLVRCLGNLEFAERILAMFQERFDQDLVELDRLWLEGDAPGVARLAHRLKGASANAAARGLHWRVSQIEQLARQASLTAVGPHLDHLRQEWETLRQSLPLVGSAAGSDE